MKGGSAECISMPGGGAGAYRYRHVTQYGLRGKTRAAPSFPRPARIQPFITPFYLPARLPITAALQNVKPQPDYLTLSSFPTPEITRSHPPYLTPLAPLFRIFFPLLSSPLILARQTPSTRLLRSSTSSFLIHPPINSSLFLP